MKRNDRRRILAVVALAAALTLFLCGCSGAETASGDFAALPSAEPQYVDAWPENDLTARIPEPQDGAVDYVRDFSDDGKYEIVWDFGSDAAFEEYIDTFRTSKFSPFREANRKVNFCRFFKGSRRFSAVQKLSVHPPIVYAVLRKFTAFWRKLWRKFCAHIRGWPQPVQTPFRRTHSCCGCRHPR